MVKTQDTIKVGDLTFAKYIDKESIDRKVIEMAKSISSVYQGKTPLFLVVMNGAFMFAADLIRKLDFAAEVVFIRVKSYHGTQSTGHATIYMPDDVDIRDRHIIVLEDIIDTGNSMSLLLPALEKMMPASVALSSILVKPEALVHELKIDFPGFEIPNKFVVGYGLDYNGLARNLEDIYQLAE